MPSLEDAQVILKSTEKNFKKPSYLKRHIAPRIGTGLI